jgi:hypothetical protein
LPDGPSGKSAICLPQLGGVAAFALRIVRGVVVIARTVSFALGAISPLAGIGALSGVWAQLQNNPV